MLTVYEAGLVGGIRHCQPCGVLAHGRVNWSMLNNPEQPSVLSIYVRWYRNSRQYPTDAAHGAENGP
jgi:predicted Fe-S protein YdhL (DUF1289 family)